MYMEVEDAKPRGRSRKTWLEVIKNDLMSCLEDENCGGYMLTQVCPGADPEGAMAPPNG